MPKQSKPEDLLSELLAVRLTKAEMKRFDAMMKTGRYASRQELARSLIRCILDDDAQAHGEPRLDREHLHA